MKKKGYLIASILITLGLLVWYREPVLKAAGGVFALDSSVKAPETIELTISTSTLNYMTPGAGTTTLQVYTEGADQLDLNIFMQASSTLTDLRWRVEFSHSTTSVASQQLWFPEVTDLNASTATTTNQVRIGREYRWLFASTTAHRIGTSTAMSNTFDQNTVSARTFRVSNVAARWTRIIFYIPTGSITNSVGNISTCCTSLGDPPAATSTNAGISVQAVTKQPY